MTVAVLVANATIRPMDDNFRALIDCDLTCGGLLSAQGARRNAPSMQQKTGPLTMNKLTLALKNCYGIKKLGYKFDFSDERVYAIYAPNGVMKSSLAQTFYDEATGATSADRIFPARECIRKITDENGDSILQIVTKSNRCDVVGFHRTSRQRTARPRVAVLILKASISSFQHADDF